MVAEREGALRSGKAACRQPFRRATQIMHSRHRLSPNQGAGEGNGAP